MSYQEFGSSNLKDQVCAQFPTDVEAYLRVLSEFGNDVQVELLHGTGKLDTETINQLQELSDAAQRNLSPFVREALDDLRYYFSDFRLNSVKSLYKDNTTLILYGSLQYNDPRNADVDLIAVTLERSENTPDHYVRGLGDGLVDFWDTKLLPNGNRRGQPHFGTITVLSDYEDIPHLLERDHDGSSLDDIASIISGIPLFPEYASNIQALKAKAIELASQDSLLCAVTNVTLRDCLKVRISRRVHI